MTRRATRACGSAVAIAWALSAGGPLRAQTESLDARATADVLFTAGRELMGQGRYAEACRKLEESYRVSAAGGTLLNLALCHVKEGRIASAWAEYRDSAEIARLANRPDREKVAHDAMVALEASLPRVVLRVPEGSRVPGLAILRNGAELAEPSWGVALPVDPGEVSVEARAPGYMTWTGKVTATIAGSLEVVVPPLAPEPELAVVPPAPAARPLGPTWWTGRSTLAVSLAGLGVASIGVGSYFGVQSLQRRTDSDAGCPSLDGRLRCTVAGAQAMSDAQTYAWVSDFGIGLGAIAVIGGAVLLLTSPRQSATGARSPSIQIGAFPVRGGGGALASGSWD